VNRDKHTSCVQKKKNKLEAEEQFKSFTTVCLKYTVIKQNILKSNTGPRGT